MNFAWVVCKKNGRWVAKYDPHMLINGHRHLLKTDALYMAIAKNKLAEA